jgi:hypothetical protein
MIIISTMLIHHIRKCLPLTKIFKTPISLTSQSPRFFQSSNTQLKQPTNLEEYEKVFHFPYIRQVAYFARLKVIVTGVTVGFSPIILASSCDQLLGISFVSLMGFSSISLLGIGEFMRKVIGIVYLDENQENVRFARVTFWGKRADQVVPIDEVKLVSDTSEDVDSVFWKVEFYDDKAVDFYITTRFGGIEDMDKFKLIFGSDVSKKCSSKADLQ